MVKPNSRLSAIVISLAFALVTVFTWAWLNRPEKEPEWPRVTWGFALSPFRPGQDAVKEEYPTREQIAEDLDLLKGKTQAIRTYTVSNTIGLVPELAGERGLNVALGVWIDARVARDEQELDRAIDLAKTHRNVARIIVGNESVLRNDLPLEQFIGFLDRARASIAQPISTAEPWHVWIKHPELVDHVDYITIHLLPYWEGIDVEKAVQYSIDRCLLYTSPSPRDRTRSRMPSSA